MLFIAPTKSWSHHSPPLHPTPSAYLFANWAVLISFELRHAKRDIQKKGLWLSRGGSAEGDSYLCMVALQYSVSGLWHVITIRVCVWKHFPLSLLRCYYSLSLSLPLSFYLYIYTYIPPIPCVLKWFPLFLLRHAVFSFFHFFCIAHAIPPAPLIDTPPQPECLPLRPVPQHPSTQRLPPALSLASAVLVANCVCISISFRRPTKCQRKKPKTWKIVFLFWQRPKPARSAAQLPPIGLSVVLQYLQCIKTGVRIYSCILYICTYIIFGLTIWFIYSHKSKQFGWKTCTSIYHQ